MHVWIDYRYKQTNEQTNKQTTHACTHTNISKYTQKVFPHVQDIETNTTAWTKKSWKAICFDKDRHLCFRRKQLPQVQHAQEVGFKLILCILQEIQHILQNLWLLDHITQGWKKRFYSTIHIVYWKSESIFWDIIRSKIHQFLQNYNVSDKHVFMTNSVFFDNENSEKGFRLQVKFSSGERDGNIGVQLMQNRKIQKSRYLQRPAVTRGRKMWSQVIRD